MHGGSGSIYQCPGVSLSTPGVNKFSPCMSPDAQLATCLNSLKKVQTTSDMELRAKSRPQVGKYAETASQILTSTISLAYFMVFHVSVLSCF